MNLHNEIMNIAAKPPHDLDRLEYDADGLVHAYRIGHRDARHAAAELALKADALADALREIAKQDHVKLMLDPQWAAGVARIALTEAGMTA